MKPVNHFKASFSDQELFLNNDVLFVPVNQRCHTLKVFTSYDMYATDVFVVNTNSQ